jgi:predicted DNA-binding transcriptional regulator YafY
VPKGFDLQAFIDTGRADFALGRDPVRLVARVHPEAAQSILERKLNETQRVTKEDDGWYRLEVTLRYTYAVQVWILGFAEGMEVVEPEPIRQVLARKLRDAAARYG